MPAKGIARGCALSSLMGALRLWAAGNYFSNQDKNFYGRDMDDLVNLTHTRWQLRKQVKQLNKYLASMWFEKHPDKTFIGKVSRGFDWLGEWLTDKGTAGIAPCPLANHYEKGWRLDEQTRRWSKPKQARHVSDYRKWWKIWAIAISVSSASVQADNFTVAAGETQRSSYLTRTVRISGSGASNIQIHNGNDYPGAFGLAAYVGIYGGSCMDGLKGRATTTSDGWYGISLGNDVIIGFSGTFTGAYVTSERGTFNVTTSLATNGTATYTNSTSPEGPLCGNMGGGTLLPDSASQPAQFSGTYFVHAGPNATPGTYAIPTIYLQKTDYWYAASNPTRPILVPAGSVSVTTSTVCTVAADQSSIRFGTVNTMSAPGGLIATRATQLTTSCDAVSDGGDGSNHASVTLSVAGATGGNPYALSLTGADATTEIAQIFGHVGGDTGRCSGTTGDIRFDGAPITFGTVGLGMNTSMITWSLCSNGSNATGEGAAQAVLTVEWP